MYLITGVQDNKISCGFMYIELTNEVLKFFDYHAGLLKHFQDKSSYVDSFTIHLSHRTTPFGNCKVTWDFLSADAPVRLERKLFALCANISQYQPYAMYAQTHLHVTFYGEHIIDFDAAVQNGHDLEFVRTYAGLNYKKILRKLYGEER